MQGKAITILAILAAAAAGAALALGVYAVSTDDVGSTSTVVQTTAVAAGGGDLADLYERAAPGVVEISVSGATAPDRFGVPPDAPGAQPIAQGTGFVIDDEGHILTNEHVVEDAEEIRVSFPDGATVTATLVGTDASTDVAVIEVDRPADELTPLPLGDSSSVRVGQSVVALGSPFGLEGTLTAGIVSAVGRTVRAPNGYAIAGAIQTDAAINSGNSGGPLLDLGGKVLGINAQIESSSGGNEGIGFAIPIDVARDVAEQLIAGETVEHAYLGTSLTDADPPPGAEIGEVRESSPAEEAGLRAGDVVTELDGAKIQSADDLVAAIAALRPGDEVELTVRSDGETRTVTVTLGDRPS